MTRTDPPHHHTVQDFINELSLAPVAYQRLIRVHLANDNGRCTACGLPGYGSGHVIWPCGPVSLALAAQEVAEQRENSKHEMKMGTVDASPRGDKAS